MPSTDSVQSLQNSNDVFHRNIKKKNPKICMKQLKTPDSQSHPEKKNKLETSQFLIPNFITKL